MPNPINLCSDSIITYWIQQWNNLPGTVRDSFYVEKDTTYNGLEYKKVRAGSHEYSGALMREDTLTGKVWYKPIPIAGHSYNSRDTSEMLIIDLNINVGDTFDLGYWSFGFTGKDTNTNIVDSVYYIGPIKHIRFKTPIIYNEKLEFIEGVGLNIGINYRHFPSVVGADYLICSYKDDTVTYRNKHHGGNCDVRFGDMGAPEVKSISVIHVYPNPARETLHFLFPSGDVTIKLTDISGRIADVQVIKNDVKAIFDVQHYTPGIYLYQVITQQGVHSGRVLINK